MTEHHDSIVKKIFGQPWNAAGYLKAVLPASLVATLDLDETRKVSSSFIDEKLVNLQADLLFEIPFVGADPENDPDDPATALVYVLFEHQSTIDHLMAFRLLRYMVRIWQDWLAKNPKAKRLPLIVPLVLYQGLRPWKAARRFAELLAPPEGTDIKSLDFAPDFRFLLHELATIEDDQIPSEGSVRLTLFFMKHIWDRDLGSRTWRCIEEIRRLTATERGLQEFQLIVQYVVDAGTGMEDRERFKAAFEEAGESAKEVLMTLAEEYREEGRQQKSEEMRSLAEEYREEGRREVREAQRSIAEQIRQEVARDSITKIARRLIEQGMSAEKVADIVDMKLPELTELLAESPSQPE